MNSTKITDKSLNKQILIVSSPTPQRQSNNAQGIPSPTLQEAKNAI
jgi:hypothetical protein